MSQLDVASLSFLCPERTNRLCACTSHIILAREFHPASSQISTGLWYLLQPSKKNFVTLSYTLTDFLTSFWNADTELSSIINSYHNVVYTKPCTYTLFTVPTNTLRKIRRCDAAWSDAKSYIWPLRHNLYTKTYLATVAADTPMGK